MKNRKPQQFVLYFWFTSWLEFSIGLHLCLAPVNFEIHLPFGFVRIGWVYSQAEPSNWNDIGWRRKAIIADKWETK
jgi:hypothetical protein